jgi:hypothetical protein
MPEDRMYILKNWFKVHASNKYLDIIKAESSSRWESQDFWMRAHDRSGISDINRDKYKS